MPHSSPSQESLMQKIAHLSGITAEGLAGQAMAEIMMLVVQLTFNSSYWEQVGRYEHAKDQDRQINLHEKELLLKDMKYYEQDENGQWPEIRRLDKDGKPRYDENPEKDRENIIPPQCATDEELKANHYFRRAARMTYEPDENGKYPEVYALNNQYQVDYTRVVENGEATPEELIANGFIPRPSYVQGLKNVFAGFVESVQGFDALSPEEKLWLHPDQVDSKQGNDNSADLARDNAARMAAQARPAPKPATK